MEVRLGRHSHQYRDLLATNFAANFLNNGVLLLLIQYASRLTYHNADSSDEIFGALNELATHILARCQGSANPETTCRTRACRFQR